MRVTVTPQQRKTAATFGWMVGIFAVVVIGLLLWWSRFPGFSYVFPKTSGYPTIYKSGVLKGSGAAANQAFDVYDANNAKAGSVAADESGNFSLTLAPGTYSLVARDATDKSPHRITIVAGQDTALNFGQ